MPNLIVLSVIMIHVAGALAFVHADEEVSRLPLHYHAPGQKLLAVVSRGEQTTVRDYFAARATDVEIVESFDESRSDYSEFYAIVAGSNAVDYYQKKDASTFQPLVDFVAKGGHMFFFGSFNGRNLHGAKPLGLTTRFYHNELFELIPGRSEVLFSGYELDIPDSRKCRSFGAIFIERPFIEMLGRGSNGPAPSRPALATWTYGKGRVSATMIEPNDSGLWIVNPCISWIERGAPTTPTYGDPDQIEPHEDADPIDGSAKASTPLTQAIADPISLTHKQRANGYVPSTKQASSLRAAALSEYRNKDVSADVMAKNLYAMVDTVPDLLARSVRLELTADLAAESGDAMLAFDAIDRAAETLSVDVPGKKLELLKAVAKVADQDQAAAAAELALEEVPGLREAFRFDDAVEYLRLARELAAAAGRGAYQDIATDQLKVVMAELETFESGADVLTAWAESPANPSVRHLAGRFLAFQMRAWDVALPELAAGGNEELKELAADSITVPDEPALVIRLGDRWLRLAAEANSVERASIESFVRNLYRELGDGLRTVSAADRRRATEFLAAAPTVSGKLTFGLTLDGYGLLTITPNALAWETKSGLEPEVVLLDEREWTALDEPWLNRGASRVFDPDIDLSTARLADVDGRGLVRIVERRRERVVVRVNDIPVGESDYEFTLRFGDGD